MLYKKSCTLLCVLLVFFATVSCTQALAVSSEDQSARLINADAKSLWDNISLKVIVEEPSVAPISCFDVNTEGQVALGFQTNNKKTIAIYSNDKTFLYGYTFYCNGSYYVFWEQDHICIYFIRGRVVVSVDKDGNCISVSSADDAVNIDRLNIIEAASKEVDGIRYYLENDMIIGDTFGRLCVQKSDGTELVFYDATELHNARIITTIIAVACFTTIVLIFAVKRTAGQTGQ